MKYNIDYFIKKFEAIPEDKWCVGDYNIGDKYCAYGHCGLGFPGEYSTESQCLSTIMGYVVVSINDGDCATYQQPTPKQRILAALYNIKRMQQPQYPDITADLAVLPEERIETDVIKQTQSI